MTLYEQILAVRKLVDTRKKWAAGALALDAAGAEVSIGAGACRFCIEGAIAQVLSGGATLSVKDAYKLADRSEASLLIGCIVGRGPSQIYGWSDRLCLHGDAGHAEFLSVIDEAAEHARRAGV